uniref:Prolyl 4-hydroxylase alpha subunit Fe(2+) 2OG dioxygenase domain-containing protein n=1 Tax=Aplanochytrium stocchinoi TaxID=215587 RepID=A0A7S3LHU6_9STRA
MEQNKQTKIRHIQRNVFTTEECQNLQRIHQGSCAVGYMPNISILTLRDLWCLNSVHHFLPIVALRDRVREIVEKEFDCFGELYFEWTSINCWSEKSYIRKHYDSNREYLNQRHYSAVVYLNSKVNSPETDKNGFKEAKTAENNSNKIRPHEEGRRSEYSYISPETGLLICFSSGPENEHFVTRVDEGKRWALTLWFTKDPEYAEPELKYFLPRDHGSGPIPSLWETKVQRIQLEKQLLNDSGFMLHTYAGVSHEKIEQSGKSWLDTALNFPKKEMELISTASCKFKVSLCVRLNAELFRRLLQFAAYVKYGYKHSLGVAILNTLKDQTELTINGKHIVLNYLDHHFEEWIAFEENAIEKLEECKHNWMNDSAELIGGVSDLDIKPNPHIDGKAKTKQLFRKVFSPVVSIVHFN